MVFTTYLCNMDISTTKKMLVQVIGELESKKEKTITGQHNAFLSRKLRVGKKIQKLTNY